MDVTTLVLLGIAVVAGGLMGGRARPHLPRHAALRVAAAGLSVLLILVAVLAFDPVGAPSVLLALASGFASGYADLASWTKGTSARS